MAETIVTIPDTVTGMCGNVLKAVYWYRGYDSVKLTDEVPTLSRVKLEDGTEITPYYITGRTGSWFDFAAYDSKYEGEQEITVYIYNRGTELVPFTSCPDLLELYVPDGISSLGNWGLKGDSQLRKLVLGRNSALTWNNGAFMGTLYAYKPGYTIRETDPVIISYANPAPTLVYRAFGPSNMDSDHVGYNGILYYPVGADYSDWMASDDIGYLGYFGWSSQTFTMPYYDCSAPTPFDEDPPIPSGGTVDSGSTSHTITYSGCPLVFDHSASTGTWNTLPTVTTGGTTNDWWITYDVPANDTDAARTITYYYLRYSGQSCSDLIDTVSYTISQAAGSGTPTPSDAYIRFVDTAITLTGSYVSAALEVSGCTSTSDYRAYTGTGAIDFTVIYQFYDTCTINANPNTGSTQLESDLRVEFMDTDGNVYYDTIHVIQPVSTPADRYIRFADSAVTMNTNVGAPLEVSGCDSTYVSSAPFSGTGNIDFTAIIQNYSNCGINANQNMGATQLESDLRVEFQDTSGNTYYDTIHVVQPKQVKAYFDPASISVSPAPGTASTTAVGLNCTVASVAFDRITWSGGTWAVDPTFTINGDVVTFQVPENTTNQFRYVIYYFTITDTDGNTYTGQFYLGQYNMRVYLDPTSRSHGAGTVGSGQFYVKPSGTTISSSYTPTITLSGEYDWITGTSIDWWETSSEGSWRVRYYFDRNLSNHDKVAYITVDGVHNFYDDAVFDGLVFTATKGWSAYTFLNYDSSSASSAASVDTIEVVPVNTTICSVSVTGSASSTPDLWTGVTQPTVTVLGNYITVNWPQNPHTSERNLQLTVEVVWGENCEKTTNLTYQKNQEAAGTPSQKDIKAADTSYSVGSGSGNASTTVQTTGCTYDHFTYITGGSFSVTATSGPNNTILFYYPQNPTTSPRTGYVYITFYDGDGNSYGPQTISFTQQAGSSPGPGPGPDPETGYVLTTLTISDQEQHRYFVEARPGVVYSAAGQYYKTIPACEARYSLYYVNSYGGVDVLPFKGGGQKKTDNITRFNYSRSFRNNTPEFENVNYMNEIKAVWELQTGWIGDDGSSRMHELVESTIVYLYDAEEKTYTPVVMTDKKLEYKTYRNQGRKFYNYTINVEESQSRERR